ncbi:MAG: ABC transporter ATP-binding protein [Spirochaetaceae bacterium]|nr:MAG: ABC transporter ATP-binding protein [Spirochaetaceae bacterium]
MKLNGTDIRRVAGSLHQHVGMVFQDAEHQIIGQTVREDLAFGPIHHGMPLSEVESRVTWMMGQVGLEDRADADPHTLSGGELRRLAVAGVVITGARYVILDEPFSSLDPPGVREVLSAVLHLRSQGCGIMIITHELEKVLAHADRLVILHRGRIETDSHPEAALEQLPRFQLRRPPGSLKEMTWHE